MTDRRARGRQAQPGEVVAWRAERLAAAGFPRALARALARDPGMDLHALIGLTERGCPPEIAARIQAPLDPQDQVDAVAEARR
jgi:hypothetical protein